MPLQVRPLRGRYDLQRPAQSLAVVDRSRTCRLRSPDYLGRRSRVHPGGATPREAPAIASRPPTRPRLATVGLEARRRWTAAAHVLVPLQVRPLRGRYDLQRPAQSLAVVDRSRTCRLRSPDNSVSAEPGSSRWSHPREARLTRQEGAHGGTMGSPVMVLVGE